MTRIEATITGVGGLSALAMARPAARAEDSKEANPEVEKIRALLKAHDEAMTNHDLKGVMASTHRFPASSADQAATRFVAEPAA